MMNRKHIYKKIALLSMLLLIGQFGVLTHSVEHPFHAQNQSCQIFLQCENSDDGLIFHVLQVATLAGPIQSPSRLVSTWLPTLLTAYSSRAPPVLS